MSVNMSYKLVLLTSYTSISILYKSLGPLISDRVGNLPTLTSPEPSNDYVSRPTKTPRVNDTVRPSRRVTERRQRRSLTRKKEQVVGLEYTYRVELNKSEPGMSHSPLLFIVRSEEALSLCCLLQPPAF